MQGITLDNHLIETILLHISSTIKRIISYTIKFTTLQVNRIYRIYIYIYIYISELFALLIIYQTYTRNDNTHYTFISGRRNIFINRERVVVELIINYQ